MTARTRVLIADDEPLARERLRSLLGAEDWVEVVAECQNGTEAVDSIARLQPDLVFLDVQMPGATGFDVIDAVGPDRMPLVVFVTAFDKYALRAFDVHAVDYLLKPFSEERLAEALDRARQRLVARQGSGEGEGGDAPLDVDALVKDARERRGPLERVLIRDGAQVHVIAVDRIDYVEAQDDYVCFVADGKSYLKDQTMGAVEASLDPARFVRIHRSYLLNIERIARVVPRRVALVHPGQ